MIAGAYGYEVPPVPIPNTEVKLIHAEDTQMVTSRENRAAPALIIFISYSSIAQSVERMTVNHDVAGSSPRWCTKRPVGQVVKTPPSHGGIRSSNLLRVTKESWKATSRA